MMKKRIINIKKPAGNSRKVLSLALAAVLFVSGCSIIVPEPSESNIANLANTEESTPVVSDTEATASGTSDVTGNTTTETTEEELEDQEEIVNTFPASYKNTIGKCTFDIDKLECPEEVIFHKAKARLQKANYRKFADDTLKGLPYKEDDGLIYSVDDNNKWYYCFTLPDITIDFIKYGIPYTDSVSVDFESENYNLYKYAKPQTFAFGSAEECFEKVANIFGKYGVDIKTGTTVDTYYLDHELLLKGTDMSDAVHKAVKVRNWTADDDAYLFVVKQSVQGITLSPMGSFLWPGSFHELSDVGYIIIYNKDGLAEVQAWQEYCTFELSPATEKLLTFDDLAQNISDYLAYSSDDSKYTITKAKLFGHHDHVGNMTDSKPVELYWAVWVKEKNNGKVTEYELRFNAKTGEIATRLAD